MDDDENDVEEQEVESDALDAGGGSECMWLDSEWVTYLAEAEIPGNVTGVDESIEDFGEPGESAGQEYANV